PEMTLEEGLWVQWKNRMRFIMQFPVYFKFFEQFRHSPLILHKDVQNTEFKTSMRTFVTNAVKRGQMQRMEPEQFWALAYGPFYSILKFHLQNKSMMNDTYVLTETKLKNLFRMVLQSLRP